MAAGREVIPIKAMRMMNPPTAEKPRMMIRIMEDLVLSPTAGLFLTIMRIFIP